MSESDHQSFYEIQLNTSHLLLVFLGAVVVGVTIFYLGVVIGRGSGTSSAMAGDWGEAAPVERSGQESGNPQDAELGFYEEIKEEPGGEVASTEESTGGSGTSAGGDAGNDTDAGAAAGDAAPTGGGPEAEAGGQGRGGSGAEPSDRSDTVADAETVAAPTEAIPEEGSAGQQAEGVAAAGELPQADPGLGSGWVIQVRSTTDRAQADGLTRALVADGFQAFVVSAEIDGTTWFRVRVGRYGSRDDAEQVEQRLAGRPDIEQTWVTEG